jgi:sortase A
MRWLVEVESLRPQKKKALLWIERVLLLVGVLALGSYAYAWVDARWVQYMENRRLEEALAAQPPVPAAETDALGSFQKAEAPPEPAPELEEGELIGRIEIPSAGVSAMILEGVAYKTLRRGVGHIPGTPLPRWDGNVGLAAHRDSFFRGLKDIRKNDIITLKTLHGTFQYRVESTEIVRPKDTHVLEDTDKPVLTLVTCYPFYYVGSAPKRFIVRAERVEGEEAAGGM